MKRIFVATGLGLAFLVAACGPKTESHEAATGNTVSEAASRPAAMDNMAMAESDTVKTAKGIGTVTEIDKAGGTITLDHGPIAEANWPAMTMGFKARPELLQTVKPGDKVAFDLELKDGSGEVTAITKQ